MLIKFIAHAGFCIVEGSTSILIDPWFTGSTVAEPVLKSIGGHTTIDFLRPTPVDSIDLFQPDGIFVSHLHTHHSHQADIERLVNNSSKQVALVYPNGTETERGVIAKNFAGKKLVSLFPIHGGEVLSVGSLKISVLSHPAPHHFAYLVEGKSGSFLHIADSLFNADPAQRRFDPLWEKFFSLKPDYVAMTTGGHSLRFVMDGVRKIRESGGISAIEAAQLIEKINPKAVSVMGIFNNSIWRNNTEYAPPPGIIEEEFYWAVEWLAPQVKMVFLRPGHTIAVGELGLAEKADSLIL